MDVGVEVEARLVGVVVIEAVEEVRNVLGRRLGQQVDVIELRVLKDLLELLVVLLSRCRQTGPALD